MIKHLFIEHKSKRVESGEGVDFSKKNGCVWIYSSSPSEEEKEGISKEFNVDKNLFVDYTKQVRSKRYSTNPLIFVMVDYFPHNGYIKKTNILVILEKDVFITIFPMKFFQYEEIFREIFEYMNEKPKNERNIGEVLYEFLDRDVQDNYEVLRVTEEKIADFERKILVEKQKLSEHISHLLNLKRDLFAMSRRFWSTAKIIFLLRKGLFSIDISKRTIGLLDDTYDTFQHQIEVLETQREMIGDILTLYEASVSNHLATISNDLNQIMKKLTSLTVIVLIPSLIASIYGMNFKYLPQISSETGFWEVILFMAFIAGVLYWRFHRRRWI